MKLQTAGIWKLIILGIIAFASYSSFSQVSLLKDDFSPGPSNWGLNSVGVIHGSVTVTGSENVWTINNSYTGRVSPFVANTNAQPVGISGAPNSHYLHILSSGLNAGGTSNANYTTVLKKREQYMTSMVAPINASGYKDITLNFWWLNYADSLNHPNDTSGQVFYSTDGGTTWIRTPKTYSKDSIWQKESIKLPVFDNQPSLKFAFVFINPDVGESPAFAIDDVEITGTPTSTPTSNFTGDKTLICKGKCVQFSDLSLGNPTQWSWSFGTGNAADTSNLQNPKFCFPNNVGKYSITLTASNSRGAGGPITKTNYIDVIDCNAAPKANFSMNGLNGNLITICSGDSVVFADSSTGQVDNIYWSFPGAFDSNTAGLKCRIVNDTVPVVKILYACAGGEGRDTTYTVTLNVSGVGGASFITKRVRVKSCIGAVAKIRGHSSQRKSCVNQCVTFEYDVTVEEEFYITEKPSFKWYFYGIDTSVTHSDTLNSATVCYADSGTFNVALVTENKYGKDSIMYRDLVSVFGYPSVKALVDKPLLLQGYSNELSTNNRESFRGRDVPNCRDMEEFDKFVNGDSSRCHNYFWSYKNGDNDHVTTEIDNFRSQTTRARPDGTTWYYVIRENYNGCRGYDSVLISIDSTYNVGIPSIFTPGKNGSKNSRWYVFGNRITKIDVKVFNRYGQIVYETRDIKEIVWESDISPVGAGWDGNFRNEAGKELDPGVYVYVIELYNKSGEVKNLKGNVTLVR